MRTAPTFVMAAMFLAAPWIALSALAQSAKDVHEIALHHTPDQGKAVQLLCQAAKMEPKNKEFQNDCDTARIEMIRADKDSLRTAQDAADANNAAKAKRYAAYVSITDPELHRQAAELMAKLNAPAEKPASPAAPASQAPALALAQNLYDLGNLASAKNTAQSITDPSLKTSADRIVHDVDRYSAFVSEGDRHAQAKEYDAASGAYQSAMALNPHVSADDLATKSRSMHDLAANANREQAKAPTPNRNPPPPTVDPRLAKQVPAPVENPADKARRLLAEGMFALNHNDLDVAGRKLKQVLDIDAGNAEAKQGLTQISSIISKDPVRLEKTLRDAITAFYSSQFEDVESKLNRYLGADAAKKKGAAYFYLGATEAALSLLEDAPRRTVRVREAQDDFKQARSAGYQPIEKYVSSRVLYVWKGSGI
ncbi:hypothetical protein [Granulicella arctica]|uniref:hypothetical protein n=1 Tax=Granulicella arctica TaxID=940613 RepID=UPI0021E06A5C|nr:hypothetical protein [Granulicella arctica]